LVFSTKSLCALSAELPDSVSKALKEAGISSQNVAVVVQAVDADTPIIRHNELQAMNPASTSKLLTTYAALELLGPAYTWKTDALADATPGKGLLNGNLYLRGSGDPKLTLEQFWLLLRQLRTRGISRNQRRPRIGS
jgi:D-alanyl-D-alanine carboxypeptidase/D-alanyl-D-alanine-endopeptidase (penicillin-binding protein 4)